MCILIVFACVHHWSLAMVYSAVLESYLHKLTPCRGGEYDKQPAACEINDEHEAASLNVWIVAGPYILVGMAEIFASITSLEYAFTKVCIFRFKFGAYPYDTI